jgi:hypothetical protein
MVVSRSDVSSRAVTVAAARNAYINSSYSASPGRPRFRSEVTSYIAFSIPRRTDPGLALEPAARPLPHGRPTYVLY